ncbi:hypothetical protein CRG98_009816 [Punica granatum]|uniref:Bifunctional inhibitor/plant lipid transfer protein/seed storage helical domain-containing protein n=1 Tax=Punica granatum TaxID=22663 RepID=A0A2I0KN78_PUNGR|nr:hypothetical protein CRG98_009816 [Punica granatum]
MKLKSSSTAFLAVPLLAALLLLASRDVGGAVTCMASELAPCLPAITSPAAPTTECCTKLKEQQPCLCGYLKDPTLKMYWTSPNAKKVADACGIPYPIQC